MSATNKWTTFLHLVQSELLQQAPPAHPGLPNPPPTAPLDDNQYGAGADVGRNLSAPPPPQQHIVDRIVVLSSTPPVQPPLIVNAVEVRPRRERSRSRSPRRRRSSQRSRSSSPELSNDVKKDNDDHNELSTTAAIAIGAVAVAGFSALVHQYYQDSGRLRKLAKLFNICESLLGEEHRDKLSKEQRAFVKKVKKLVNSIGCYQTRASRWKLFGIGSFAVGAAATLALPITWPFFAATAFSVVGAVANYAQFTYVESQDNEELLTDVRNNCARISALPAPQLTELPDRFLVEKVVQLYNHHYSDYAESLE